MGKLTYETALNVYNAHLLYIRYKNSPNHFPEKRKNELINGLVRIIQGEISESIKKLFEEKK